VQSAEPFHPFSAGLAATPRDHPEADGDLGTLGQAQVIIGCLASADSGEHRLSGYVRRECTNDAYIQRRYPLRLWFLISKVIVTEWSPALRAPFLAVAGGTLRARNPSSQKVIDVSYQCL
jgi:hypothetical protein